MSFNSLLENIVANIVSSVVIFLLVAIIGWFVISGQRRKLHRFFGISRGQPLLVYLSGLVVSPNTIQDRFGYISKYEGLAVPNYEFQVIPRISSLFLSNPLDSLPELFSELLDNMALVKKPIIDFRLSPLNEKELEYSSSICVGSGLFNTATDYYLREGRSYFRPILDKDRDQWIVQVLSPTGEIADVVCPDEKENIGVLLRLRDVAHNTITFIAAGTGINGTRASVEYLVGNWGTLSSRYKDMEFGVALTCPKFIVDPEGYKYFKVIKQLPV
jgi:hypothetical protein